MVTMPFFISIIFLGIILIVLSLLWILFDRKKSGDYTKKLEEKKDELVRVISDSEQMLEELNKFSDYIVTQISAKNDELSNTLQKVDNKLQQVNTASSESKEEIKTIEPEVVENAEEEKQDQGHFKQSGGSNIDYKLGIEEETNGKIDLVLDGLEHQNKSAVYTQSQILQKNSNSKITPINSRHKDVVQLAEKGLSEAEIAKALNIGKGEIKLILGMYSDKLKTGKQ